MNFKTFTTLILCLFTSFLFGQTSPYCNTQVTHFAGDAGSEIFLTIENTGANSMQVIAESADTDPVDDLIIVNGTGAAQMGPTETSPGV